MKSSMRASRRQNVSNNVTKKQNVITSHLEELEWISRSPPQIQSFGDQFPVQIELLVLLQKFPRPLSRMVRESFQTLGIFFFFFWGGKKFFIGFLFCHQNLCLTCLTALLLLLLDLVFDIVVDINCLWYLLMEFVVKLCNSFTVSSWIQEAIMCRTCLQHFAETLKDGLQGSKRKLWDKLDT